MMTITGGGLTLELDAVIEESPDRTVEATEHPVEEGVNPVDHVRPKARELKLVALVTDSRYAADEAEPGRSRDAHATLSRLMVAATLFTITDGLERYENMLLLRLGTTLTKTIGQGALRLNLVFRELRVVSTQTVALQVRKRVPKAKGKQDDGPKSKQEISRSALKKTFDPKKPDDAGNVIKKGLGGLKALAGG